ncbi:hypothetical protein [Aurantibacillus circumpalustris]|uniref:hypothetical protein n=1 Tax=Aurantibacillus circumpalustris TaxID=3036359 RepID=UPI00295BA678|nr:hypothetical protein [Aurantibacillus circumpalustris]
MTTKININGKDVEIILTPEQIEEVKKVNLKITDRVKNFADAFRIAGASNDLKTILDYNGQDKDMIAAQAHAKVGIIAKALNEGWFPDFSNSNQVKYYPWLKYSPGVGFSCGVCVGDNADSGVGSRLCFKSEELARYAAEQFKDIYNDLFN